MATELSRKSFGAVRFDISEPSSASTISPSRKRRSIAVPKIIETNIEENDDEAERLARREQSETGSPASTSISATDRRQSISLLAGISNLTAAEMSNQIAQCIKLSAENKINDKNAFQLKMIDFLVYALKKHDPNMSNLQMASASLDASAKIYGFRVDKVYSDLLKILGMAKQDKRDHQDEDINGANAEFDESKNDGQKKKKKKSRQHIISTVESLKGNVKTYDPLSLIRCQRDTQTSDMLFQAGLPQHANQEIILNLYNDVILDKVSKNNNSLKIHAHRVDDYTKHKICPSYSAFKFLDWSPNDESAEQFDQPDDNDGEYHFDLDAAVEDDNMAHNDIMMDCEDVQEERCNRLAQKSFENIVDFQDIIANNPNPNATYEYSYIQRNYRIHWAGPSHWKITLNKNFGGSKVVETCKQNAIKKKNDIELVFLTDLKEDLKLKFEQTNRQTKLSSKTTKFIWSEDKVTFPKNVHYDLKHYYNFFNKPTEYLKFSINENEEPRTNNDIDFDNHDVSNFDSPDDRDNIGDNDIDQFQQDQNLLYTQENTMMTQGLSQGGFTGDNLVSVPRMTDKIFIPYSQRAKKIDMRQLKNVMWKSLKKTSSSETEKENLDITQTAEKEFNKNADSKSFGEMYVELPKKLSKQNADSLSPAIAFISLLHLANEKNFKIDRCNDLADIIIDSKKSDV